MIVQGPDIAELQRYAGLLVAKIKEIDGVNDADSSFEATQPELRVDIDRPGTPGVTLEDCQRLTEALGPALDATELLESHYNLEVSSPGLVRPIRTDADVRRNRGRRVEVDVTVPVAGSRHLTGELLGMQEGALRVLLDGGEEVLLPRENVVLARQEITVSRAKERGNRVV